MNATPGNQSILRDGLALPRLLAVTLFSLAAFMGLPTAAVALKSVATGDWRVVLLMAAVWPLVWLAVWVGGLLWTGRPIPMWLVSVLGLVMFMVPFVTLLTKGAWFWAGVLLFMSSPLALAFRPGPHPYSGKPFKPEPYDELA